MICAEAQLLPVLDPLSASNIAAEDTEDMSQFIDMSTQFLFSSACLVALFFCDLRSAVHSAYTNCAVKTLDFNVGVKLVMVLTLQSLQPVQDPTDGTLGCSSKRQRSDNTTQMQRFKGSIPLLVGFGLYIRHVNKMQGNLAHNCSYRLIPHVVICCETGT